MVPPRRAGRRDASSGAASRARSPRTPSRRNRGGVLRPSPPRRRPARAPEVRAAVAARRTERSPPAKAEGAAAAPPGSGARRWRTTAALRGRCGSRMRRRRARLVPAATAARRRRSGGGEGGARRRLARPPRALEQWSAIEVDLGRAAGRNCPLVAWRPPPHGEGLRLPVAVTGRHAIDLRRRAPPPPPQAWTPWSTPRGSAAAAARRRLAARAIARGAAPRSSSVGGASRCASAPLVAADRSGIGASAAARSRQCRGRRGPADCQVAKTRGVLRTPSPAPWSRTDQASSHAQRVGKDVRRRRRPASSPQRGACARELLAATRPAARTSLLGKAALRFSPRRASSAQRHFNGTRANMRNEGGNSLLHDAFGVGTTATLPPFFVERRRRRRRDVRGRRATAAWKPTMVRIDLAEARVEDDTPGATTHDFRGPTFQDFGKQMGRALRRARTFGVDRVSRAHRVAPTALDDHMDQRRVRRRRRRSASASLSSTTTGCPASATCSRSRTRATAAAAARGSPGRRQQRLRRRAAAAHLQPQALLRDLPRQVRAGDGRRAGGGARRVPPPRRSLLRGAAAELRPRSASPASRDRGTARSTSGSG